MSERVFEPYLVTVAITTHNRSELLKRALAGVLSQSYSKLEILVSDDASNDETPQLMAEVDDPRVKYLRIESPVGIAGNFQNALDHAHGELFMILNDDDELEAGAIEHLARCFWEPPTGLKSEQILLSWCPCKIQDEKRRVHYITGSGPAVEQGIDLVIGLFDGNRGPRFCGILMRTKNDVEIGFSSEHGPIPDVGNWTRLSVDSGWVCCVPAPLARYTAHGASCTGTSPAETWQRAGEMIVRDILTDLKQSGDADKARRIRSSSRNFITGLLATVLMQSVGRPGWRRQALREFLRAPQYFVTLMTFRRLLLEGSKLIRKPDRAASAKRKNEIRD